MTNILVPTKLRSNSGELGDGDQIAIGAENVPDVPAANVDELTVFIQTLFNTVTSNTNAIAGLMPITMQDRNFLNQIRERDTDNYVRLSTLNTVINVELWLSSEILTQRPVNDPSTDTTNPRYFGGTVDRGTNNDFELNQNLSNHLVYLRVNGTLTNDQRSAIRIGWFGRDGTLINSYAFNTQFREITTFSQSNDRYYTLDRFNSGSFSGLNYLNGQSLIVQFNDVERLFNFTDNVIIRLSNLAQEIREAISAGAELSDDDRHKLDGLEVSNNMLSGAQDSFKVVVNNLNKDVVNLINNAASSASRPLPVPLPSLASHLTETLAITDTYTRTTAFSNASLTINPEVLYLWDINRRTIESSARQNELPVQLNLSNGKAGKAIADISISGRASNNYYFFGDNFNTDTNRVFRGAHSIIDRDRPTITGLGTGTSTWQNGSISASQGLLVYVEFERQQAPSSNEDMPFINHGSGHQLFGLSEEKGLYLAISQEDGGTHSRTRNIFLPVINSHWHSLNFLPSSGEAEIVIPQSLSGSLTITVNIQLDNNGKDAGTHTETISITNLSNDQTFSNRTFIYRDVRGIVVTPRYDAVNNDLSNARRVLFLNPVNSFTSRVLTFNVEATYPITDTWRSGTTYSVKAIHSNDAHDRFGIFDPALLDANVEGRRNQLMYLIRPRFAGDTTKTNQIEIGLQVILNGHLQNGEGDHILVPHRPQANFDLTAITCGKFNTAITRMFIASVEVGNFDRDFPSSILLNLYNNALQYFDILRGPGYELDTFTLDANLRLTEGHKYQQTENLEVIESDFNLPASGQTFYLNPEASAGGNGASIATPFKTFAEYKAVAAARRLTGSVTLVMLNDQNMGSIVFSNIVGNTENLHIYMPFASASDIDLRSSGTNLSRHYTLTIGNVNGNRMAMPATGAKLNHNKALYVRNSFNGLIENNTTLIRGQDVQTMTVNIAFYDNALIDIKPRARMTGQNTNIWMLNIRSTHTTAVATTNNFNPNGAHAVGTYSNLVRAVLMTGTNSPSLGLSYLRGEMLGHNFPTDLEIPTLTRTNPDRIMPLPEFPNVILGKNSTAFPRSTYVTILFSRGLVNIPTVGLPNTPSLNPRLARLTNTLANLQNVVTLPANAIQNFPDSDENFVSQITITNTIVDALFAGDLATSNAPIVLVGNFRQFINSFLGHSFTVTNFEYNRTLVAI